jgi:Ser/Thr protein kinase RdoA (MazF antagonist)
MEPRVRALFTDGAKKEALRRYGIATGDCTLLDGFESFIFNVSKEGVECVLRIGHDARRSRDMVRGESEFLSYLAGSGLSVPRVMPSNRGLLSESIPAGDGSRFVTTLFEKAAGHPPSKEEWNPALFQEMGRFLGRLHRLSTGFQPSQPRYRRFDLTQDCDEMGEIGRRCLPTGDEKILNEFEEVARDICALPRAADAYGLVHGDFHRGNFFISDRGRITLFDFDDCLYAWFVYDIAMALFYAVPHDCTSEKDLEKADTFLRNLWGGYRGEHALAPAWMAHVPLFLRLREIDLYFVIHRSMDLDALDPWCASFMNNRREKILARRPYCDLDYGRGF